MWTLFVISTVIGLEEPKVTRYAEFTHAEACYYHWVVLSSEFSEGEVAFCEKE